MIVRLLTILLFAVAMISSDTAEARRFGGFSRSIGRSVGGGSFARRSMSFGRRGAAGRFGSRRGGYARKGGFFGSSRSGRGRAMGSSAGRSRSKSNFSSYRSRKHGHSKLRSQGRSNRKARAERYYSGRNPTVALNPGYYGGRMGWGYRSVGMWDLFFLSSVNQMFWYHRWHDPHLRRALYQDKMLTEQELKKLEKRVAELEAEGVARDPNFLPEGVDPDVAYSKEYVDKDPGEFYATVEQEKAEPSGGGDGMLNFFMAALGMGLLWHLMAVRRYA